MGELQVKVNNQLGKIEFNFEELRENLSEMMDLYKDAVFTEESRDTAKKERTGLNNLRKALSDRRIEVKKEFTKPLDEFEGKVKELTALIDEPIALIDSQLAVFEEKRKEEKKAKIEKLYAESIGDLIEFLPLKKIYNTRWENATFTMKSIQEEMESAISSTDMAVNTIKEMNSDAVEKALELFKDDLSLANAIAYINKHEQMKAEILAQEERRRKEEEERKRLEEIERIKAEERKKIAEEERLEKERLAEIERAREEERLATEERLLGIRELEQEAEVPVNTEMVTYKIIGTEEDFKMVEMYLNSIGVEFIKGEF